MDACQMRKERLKTQKTKTAAKIKTTAAKRLTRITTERRRRAAHKKLLQRAGGTENNNKNNATICCCPSFSSNLFGRVTLTRRPNELRRSFCLWWCTKKRRRRKIGVGSSAEKVAVQFPILFLLLAVLCGAGFFSSNWVLAIRCYCTDEHCVPFGVCESSVCLVGLLRANNAVIRTCGSQSLGCQRNVDRWSYLCSCEENFCNTFLFLKASTNIDGPRSHPHHRLDSGSSSSPGKTDADHRVFERVDPPAGEFATFDHPMGDEEPAPIKNSNLLTLLMVIVPLSVGAAAVVVVAINYYCHLC